MNDGKIHLPRLDDHLPELDEVYELGPGETGIVYYADASGRIRQASRTGASWTVPMSGHPVPLNDIPTWRFGMIIGFSTDPELRAVMIGQPWGPDRDWLALQINDENRGAPLAIGRDLRATLYYGHVDDTTT
jgi:hypothetical protein